MVASNPAQSFWLIGFAPAWFSVASSTTDWVMSFIVRSPVISAVLSPVTSIAVEVKVIRSSSSAAKKSADMKCPSRCSQPVNIDLVGIDTLTLELVGSA